MNTQVSTEQDNSLSHISSHTQFVLERDNWYDYFPNKNACDRIFVELEKEENKGILDFFLRDTSLKIEQKVRILQILTPHGYDLLAGFDTGKRKEIEKFHFNQKTCQIILGELGCLTGNEQNELIHSVQKYEYLLVGCIRKETPNNQDIQTRTYQQIIATLHPKNLTQATKETLQDATIASKREIKETTKMFQIYLAHLLQKDAITENDLKQAHQQAKDLVRLMVLAPILIVPASAAILYLLDKIAKKMNIPLMPSQSFEDEKNKTDTDNFNS